MSLEFVREEDFVEYFLFPKLTNGNYDTENVKNDLENLLKQIQQIVEQHTADYLWHKDEFLLSIRTDAHQELIEENNDVKVILPPHLYGITHYGDNIQDEWFIVFLVFEITRKIPGIIGRVIDSDGEFLLIEAADVLPKWANPETCEQRVFIHDGHLQLVQNSPSNTTSTLPISSGISKIILNPTLYRVTGDIQNFIDERLKEFTESKNRSIHNQIIRVPIAIAAILNEKPSLIASACRAFCDRDQIDLKACRAMRFFPPENRVRTTVKFTRCLYAMISHQNYIPDRRTGWDLPLEINSVEYKEDLLGVKIACGFEILASQAKEIENDIENDRAWKVYLNSLIKKGYFHDNLEGSQDYCRLLKQAKDFYRENRSRFRTAPIVGKEIVKLLREIEINTELLKNEENNLRKSDSDSWLNITSEELEEMLTEKYGIKKLYKANGNMNAAEFTDNITEFLDKKSEFDGIETNENLESNKNEMEEPPSAPPRKIKKNTSMRLACEKSPISVVESRKEENSNQINFEPDAFATHVKNFLDFVIPEDNWESNSEMSDYEDDDDIDKNIENMENAKMSSVESDIKMYMEQMDKELSKTTIGKSFVNVDKNKMMNGDNIDDFDDIETFKPIDIDVNTLKNMMDSYKSQIGGPGPTSTLLSAMGVGVSNNIDTKNNDNEKTDDNDICETQV